MSTRVSISSPRKGLSLTIRVSALLIAAVVLPLLITVVGSEAILRPTLIAQAATEMGNDAQSHEQAIDALFIARLEDLGYLGQFFAIQRFLAGDLLYRQQAINELALGYHLDANYSAWTLFDTNGRPLLSYPALPSPRGKYMIAPEIMEQLRSTHKTLISDVYFDDNTHSAFVDMYTAITSPQGALLGIGRSTLTLNEIWTAVNNETNAAPGSFAMIIDGHGVRIAYTNTDSTLTTLPPALFKAIAPLPTAFQQRIKDEDLYGSSRTGVSVLPDPSLVAQQQGKQDEGTFQFTPALQKQDYQAYQVRCQVVPWTYIVLRPINTITGAANQQDVYLVVLAAIITVLAAFVGLFVGRGITRPILRSVSSLIKSSEMLKTLAAREQATATEQKWIVESAQAGLKSVQYYAGAGNIAARKLNETGQDLVSHWERLDAFNKQRYLNDILTAASYLEKATTHQERSSKNLSTAIRVTNQVTDQLLSGATSASEAAAQLEEVIRQLRGVVGE
ncbi:MAG TPA: cache domain-containing protein [Ktedonobacteraceae bacterium]|nr:cache domain-containing protein [Ktedonobacteraceae bacterium]